LIFSYLFSTLSRTLETPLQHYQTKHPVLSEIDSLNPKTGEYTALCSICSVFVARAMDSSPKEVVEVYAKTLEEFMTQKNDGLHATFLNDYFKRHAIRAWPLHTTLLTYLQPGKAHNIYRHTIAYELLAQLAPQLPAIAKTHQAEVNTMIPQVVDAFYATLEVTKSDEAWKADRVKDILKPILAFTRSTKSIGYEWDLERLDKFIDGIKDSRLAKFGGVTSLLAQVRSVIAKGSKGDTKAKANGSTKDSKSKPKSKKRSNGEMTEDVDVDMEKSKDDLPPVIAPLKKRKESSGSKPSKKAKTPKA
jgi:hypothetical protein